MLGDVNPVRPHAGGRDPAFAAAMRRAEGGPPAADPHPLDPIARTSIGTVVLAPVVVAAKLQIAP